MNNAWRRKASLKTKRQSGGYHYSLEHTSQKQSRTTNLDRNLLTKVNYPLLMLLCINKTQELVTICFFVANSRESIYNGLGFGRGCDQAFFRSESASLTFAHSRSCAPRNRMLSRMVWYGMVYPVFTGCMWAKIMTKIMTNIVKNDRSSMHRYFSLQKAF